MQLRAYYRIHTGRGSDKSNGYGFQLLILAILYANVRLTFPCLKGKKKKWVCRRAVGTFYNRIDAEHALNELLAAGFQLIRFLGC